MKKFIFVIMLIIILNICSTQEIQFGKIDSTQLTDGPYIFWQGEDVFVNYFVNGEAVKKIFAIYELDNYNLVIPELDFDQKIHFDHKIPNDIFKDVEKFFVISDVHGQYNQFVRILLNNQIVDEKLNWNWQNGHLVVLGDVFDRGPQVTESLWLIYKLEQQAENAGGKVHVLLGNHELMIFQNDLRYIHEKYEIVTEKLETEYSDLFSPKTVLGNWLRTKPTIIQINDLIFCHAGISPEMSQNFSDLRSINATANLIFRRENLVSDDENEKLLTGSWGAYWYRGYFMKSKKYELITETEIETILARFKAEKIIVGHTTQDSVLSLWNGKVIAVDSGIKYGDKGEALLWQDGTFYRAFAQNSKKKLDLKH